MNQSKHQYRKAQAKRHNAAWQRSVDDKNSVTRCVAGTWYRGRDPQYRAFWDTIRQEYYFKKSAPGIPWAKIDS